VQTQTDEEPLEGVRPTSGEVVAEAVAADILHALLIGYGGHGDSGEVARELFVEEDEVCEAAADGRVFLLEGGEGGLCGFAAD
jgi:hypothetical protein